MLRERPLTCLFVFTTFVVDGVLAFSGFSRELETGRLIGGFFLGQSAALGCWLAVGRPHRLARGAILVIGQVALAWLGLKAQGIIVRDTQIALAWPVGANFLLFSIPAAISTQFGRLLLRMSNRIQNQPDPLRFPLIELFGWTIVVAVASLLLRNFQAPSQVLGVVYFLAYVLSGLFVAVLHPSFQLRPIAIIVQGLMEILFLWFALRLLNYGTDLAWILSAMHLYVLAWLIVCRLDVLSPESTAPQT